MTSGYAAATASSSSLVVKPIGALLLKSSSSCRFFPSELHFFNPKVSREAGTECCISSKSSGRTKFPLVRKRGRRKIGSFPPQHDEGWRISSSSLAASTKPGWQTLDSCGLALSRSSCPFNMQVCCSLGSSLGSGNVGRRQIRMGTWRLQEQRPRRPKAKDDDFEVDDDGGFDSMELAGLDEDEEEEFRDYELEYESPSGEPRGALQKDLDTLLHSEGEVEETVVPWKINEDEFHKINLLTCDFFIRKVPDPDDDVYDFREMYVSPPDTDTYSIPKVDADLPNKPVRCTWSNYEVIHTTEPPVDQPRMPLAKTEYEVMKVFLTKHYKDRRAGHENFILDFEEIYVIDTRTKSFSRADVKVDVPGGKNRDRTLEVLIVRDQGTSFRIIPQEDENTPDEVIKALHWEKTREAMETYLRGFRDYEISNWF